jgi:hypothetical protein
MRKYGKIPTAGQTTDDNMMHEHCMHLKIHTIKLRNTLLANDQLDALFNIFI